MDSFGHQDYGGLSSVIWQSYVTLASEEEH